MSEHTPGPTLDFDPASLSTVMDFNARSYTPERRAIDAACGVVACPSCEMPRGGRVIAGGDVRIRLGVDVSHRDRCAIVRWAGA